MDFPDYSANYSKDARDSLKNIPSELRNTVDEIESALLNNPFEHRGRLVKISRAGTNFMYNHPDPKIQVTFEVDEEKKIIYFFDYRAPVLEVKRSLFISYSHEDEDWLEKIREFLTGLEQQGLIEFWDDRELEAGKPWNEQILNALDSAEAGVLLVSQKFLNSSYINDTELPKLLEGANEKGKSIYWIHVSPSMVFQTHREITKFQSLQKDPETSLEELSAISQAELRKALVQIGTRLSEAVTIH